MSTLSAIHGAKRPRETNDERDGATVPQSLSSCVALIEITHGITQSAAEVYEKRCVDLAAASQDLDALLNSTLFRQKVCRFLASRPDAAEPDGPVEVGVVQLVANDCKTLVFTLDALAPVDVSAAVGQRVCQGDMVLFQRFRSAKGDGHHVATALEFLALDSSALVDAADWCHVVSWNVMATAKWLQKLLSCPSGLAQMTCITDSFLGNIEASATSADAWLRSLQLPIFFRQLRKVDGVETRKVYQLQRFVLSVLRLYVAILGSAESIMSLPCVVADLVYQFLASPLFVEGLSVVLPQLAGNVSESTWTGAQQTMLDAMGLAVRYLCRESVEPEGKWRRAARQGAECGFFTVLHRVSGLWLKRRAEESQTGTQAFTKLGEEMARTGVFHRVTRWIRQKERAADTLGLVDNAHRPPTLQDIKDLHGLKETSVKEMMVAMTQTYTPYLRQESLRFVECAMLAAYAELYGPVARAVCKFMETFGRTRFDNAVQPKEKPLRVLQVSQTALRSSFSEYSLEEIQLHALFGLPLSVTLRATDKRSILSRFRDATSCFGYVVVILHNKTFVFPVVVCSVLDEEGGSEESVVRAVIYVLRDRDMLPSLVAATTAECEEREGLSGAWLFCDTRQTDTKDTNDDSDSHHRYNGHHPYRFGDSSPRFMPQGTSALSYMLYILHLQKLRARLREEEQGGVGAAGRARGEQGRRDAAQGGVLWWGGDSSSSRTGSGNLRGGCGPAKDFFVHSAPLSGESEALQNGVKKLTESSLFSPSQVECLYTLTSVGPGVRTLVGAVGCGKTTLMHASSLSRGQAQEALRRQHQPLWHATLKRSAQTLSGRLEELAAAEDMEDFFRVADGSSARDLSEEVTNAALGHLQEHLQLSEKLRQCHAPVLLRPRAVKQTPPSHTSRVLQEDGVMQQYHSLESVIIQSHRRSLNAPLVAVLNLHLRSLKRLGNLIDVIRRSLEDGVAVEEGTWRLYAELLPWVMSKKERLDTATEAARRKKTWAAYLSEDLWDTETIVKGNDIIGISEENVWKCIEPAVSLFYPVTLPNPLRKLCEFEQSEAAGWRAVFGEKQRELLCFLQQEIMDEAQHIFAFFLDFVQAVATTSQTSKITVVTATGRSLLQELLFFSAWQPRYLLIDDYDQLCDALYLTLSSATSVIISHQAETPLESEQHLSLVVLKALQKELQGTAFSSTVILTESPRFSSPELHKAVQLCRNSSLTFYAPLTLDAVGNNNNNDEVTANGQGTYQQGALPGLSSPCCVELWTHAVALSASVTCDGLAAAFIRNRLQGIDSSISVRIYCGFAEDRAAIVEGMLLDPDSALTCDEAEASVCMLPLYSEAFMEHDEECDVAVLCLSGIARRLRGVSAMERQQEWEEMAAERSFMGNVEWWLWRAMSYARRGAVLVGSKEVFCFLAPLQRVERFVLQVREQGGYWLPSETKEAVLALRCPEHEKCRQVALLTYADYRGCQVRVIGVQSCQSLCLAPYENCTNSSHACLRACHALCKKDDDVAAEDTDSSHSHCPFPCANVQSCGHMCVRRCGECCSPCEFVGLRELSCGQRVVSGMSDAGPVMTLVHHFQRLRCGEPPQPCEERVTLRCLRCGGKNPMACREVIARGGMENAALTERECAGCVALYNRVAREFDAAEIVPSSPPVAESLPLETLPEAAQTKLRNLQGIAVKKAQLMLQKEALETMQGKTTSDFYQQREMYDRMKKQQEEEACAHRQRVQESIGSWAKTLKQKYEVQMAVNDAVDTELPLMISEAIAEEERQRSHLFV